MEKEPTPTGSVTKLLLCGEQQLTAEPTPAGSPEMQFWGSRRVVTKSGGTARAACMGEAQLGFQELGA